ncbi:hypothetical protein NQ318_011786 [Aromia moschata]|uniref:Uncharacterized protein n=1 Tax=Aromia moschata TaxID=1265417 RepID=A0AAV8Y6R6_9CUCU|nr:hypothetical protein NQ318_011786 [Aromia moschata]
MNSAVSTNSECTIIYTYPESSPNKSSKVILKEQIIVSPSTSKKSAMDVNSQKSKEFNGENLTKQKENATNSTPTKNKNRINNAKQPSANLKAEASPSPKKKSRSDPEQQKCGGANKNTDKENECQHSPNAKETPIKDATPSSSSSTQKSVHKQYLWTKKEKATNSTPTKNRINKFKPSRAYLKAEAAPSPRKKSHSNPEQQKCGGSNKPTDKEDECQHSPKAKKIPIEDATSSSSSSPQKSIHKQNLELKSKKEGKKLDLKPVSLITELFKTVYHTRI